MTPEPDGGFYKVADVAAFIRKFGYADKHDKPDRLNFGGRHVVGVRCPPTGLTMRLAGFDAATERGRFRLLTTTHLTPARRSQNLSHRPHTGGLSSTLHPLEMSPPAAGLLVTMYKLKRPPITNLFPDLSVADLDQLPRGRAGCAQLKQLEGRLLDARRELDAKLEVINRAKPTFENWMDLELAATRQCSGSI